MKKVYFVYVPKEDLYCGSHDWLAEPMSDRIRSIDIQTVVSAKKRLLALFGEDVDVILKNYTIGSKSWFMTVKIHGQENKDYFKLLMSNGLDIDI